MEELEMYYLFFYEINNGRRLIGDIEYSFVV
jgi:hypothetical protein